MSCSAIGISRPIALYLFSCRYGTALGNLKNFENIFNRSMEWPNMPTHKVDLARARHKLSSTVQS